MKKIGFVIPWYGEDISGGAEAALRDTTNHLFEAGVDLEILSTCVKEFHSDWNENYYKEGVTTNSKGIPVRRFKVRKRNATAFDNVNIKLMQDNARISIDEEDIFLREMINSPGLYEYIRNNKDDYQAFVFIPYMFGTTYYGAKECLEKAVLMPCFHEESYTYMKRFVETYSNVAGMLFNSYAEEELTRRIYDLSTVNAVTTGLGMDTAIEYNPDRFREKYNIDGKFILYAGRKDVGKNIYTLIYNFQEYLHRNKNRTLKLVLLGGGDVNIPKEIKDNVIDLGFVDIQDKYDAYSAAELLCQPSKHESFSYVIMESWLCERPVLVHDECSVTKSFVQKSNGGLYFSDYFEFEGAINYILDNPKISKKMAINGKEFVKENFDWEVMINKYKKYFSSFGG